jgi:hypothetical protein
LVPVNFGNPIPDSRLSILKLVEVVIMESGKSTFFDMLLSMYLNVSLLLGWL